jgi:chaperonin GroES
MQVFSAIFKRLHRALGRELKQHARLNFENLTAEAYNAFFDDPEEQFDPQADYDLKSMDITPVSDPAVSSNMQKLAKSQVAREIGSGKPWINQPELDRRAFEAAEVPDFEELFLPPPKPDPAQEAFMDAMKKLSLQELVAKINKLKAEAIDKVADAESKEAGQDLSLYDAFVRYLETGHSMEAADNAQIPIQPGGLPGMGGASGNPMGEGAVPATGGDFGAGPAGGAVPSGDIPPGGLASPAGPGGAPAGAM